MQTSNGLTRVFIDTMTLAMSSVASTDKEKEFTVFIASRSQPAKGGWGGFDISRMPWSEDDVENEKRFLVNSTILAKQQFRWNLLSYQPRVDWAIDRLNKFEVMVRSFQSEDIDEVSWIPEKVTEFKMCEKHLVYKHLFGCVICEDSW